MTLDDLPIISQDTIAAHEHRHRSSTEYTIYVTLTEIYLREKNTVLYAAIEAWAKNSKDPQYIRGAAYQLLTHINDQLRADRLKREIKLE